MKALGPIGHFTVAQGISAVLRVSMGLKILKFLRISYFTFKLRIRTEYN